MRVKFATNPHYHEPFALPCRVHAQQNATFAFPFAKPYIIFSPMFPTAIFIPEFVKNMGLRARIIFRLQNVSFFVVKFYGPGEKILDLVPSIPEERQTDLKKLGLNERQIEALRLMVNEKIAFSNKMYRDHFKVSNQTFVRDMKLMAEIGQVQVIGKGRSLKYLAK